MNPEFAHHHTFSKVPSPVSLSALRNHHPRGSRLYLTGADSIASAIWTRTRNHRWTFTSTERGQLSPLPLSIRYWRHVNSTCLYVSLNPFTHRCEIVLWSRVFGDLLDFAPLSAQSPGNGTLQSIDIIRNHSMACEAPQSPKGILVNMPL
jgi:hypothetical protein